MLTIGNGTSQAENLNQTEPSTPITPILPKPTNVDYSPYALIGIVVAAGGAIYIFLRKR